jgi:excisionase family DNA binding protein
MTKLISAEDLAKDLSVSPKTLYSWAKQRKIPYVRLEGRVLFDPQEIEDWVQDRKITVAIS